MTTRTDAELIGMVTGAEDDWQPDAIEAAQQELARRNLSAERAETITAEVKKRERQAATSLDLTTKLFIALFAGTCVPGLVALYLYSRYEKQGERRKAREVLAWFGYGIAFYFVVIVLVALANR